MALGYSWKLKCTDLLQNHIDFGVAIVNFLLQLSKIVYENLVLNTYFTFRQENT